MKIIKHQRKKIKKKIKKIIMLNQKNPRVQRGNGKIQVIVK